MSAGHTQYTGQLLSQVYPQRPLHHRLLCVGTDNKVSTVIVFTLIYNTKLLVYMFISFVRIELLSDGWKSVFDLSGIQSLYLQLYQILPLTFK